MITELGETQFEVVAGLTSIYSPAWTIPEVLLPPDAVIPEPPIPPEPPELPLTNLLGFYDGAFGTNVAFGGISTWAHNGGAAPTAFQGTPTNRPQRTLLYANLNNETVVDFDGTNDYMDFTSWFNPANSYSFYAAIDLRNAVSTQQLFNINNNFILRIAPTLGYNDGVDRDAGAAISGPQILSWIFDAGSSQGTVYRNGVAIGTAMSYTSRTLTGNIFMASNSTQTQFSNIAVGGFAAYLTAHDNTQRGEVEEYFTYRWIGP